MAKKLYYAPRATRDLDDIWDYIFNNLKNQSAAEKTIDEILDTVEQLAQFPQMGKKLIFENGLDSGFRYVTYKNYIAFYHIKVDIVYIDRVLYKKMDYVKRLFPDT